MLSPLGAGGMGEVWRARDTRLGRNVAVKVLPDHLASDRRALARFESEARALAALSHPGILALFDVGREGSVAYAVTELLEGETLRAALHRGPLTWRVAIEVAAAVAEALAAAHARGIVHRDLKPENLFLCSAGHPKILDFGLARHEVAAPEAETASFAEVSTATGTLVGTVGYMAPEQLRGLPVDHRADIFAFGCVLYEMLTGHRTFGGRTSSEVIAAILHDEAPRLGATARTAPAALGEVVDRCLRKDPDQRFSSAHDIALALHAIASGAAPVIPATPRRRRAGGLLVPVLAAAIVAAVVVAAVFLRPGSGIPEVLPRQVTSGPGCESDPAISPDGESVAFLAEAEGRADLWIVDAAGGRPLRLTDGPEPAASPAWHPDGRTILYTSGSEEASEIRKVPRFGGPPQTVLRDARDPAVSPDGKSVAFSRSGAGKSLVVWLALLEDPEKARPISGNPPGIYEHRQPAWSPDGRTICYRDFHDLWLLPVVGGRARRLTHDDPADFDPVFSPDARHVYFASYRDGTRAVWRVGTGGGAPERVTLGSGMEVRPSLSRDGRRLAYATRSEGRALVLVDRRSGRRTRIEESRLVGFSSLDPAGRFVVFISSRENASDLWVTPLRDGRPSGDPRRLTELGGRATSPAVSPDGTRVAFYLVKDGQRDVYTVPVAGGEPTRVTSDPASDVSPAWSPDGLELAFVSDRDGRNQVWTVAADGETRANPARRVSDFSTWAAFPRFLPGGRHLACLSGDAGSHDLWRVHLSRGEPPARLTSGVVAYQAVPDASTGDLLVLGIWESGRCSVRAVPAGGGAARLLAWGDAPDASSEVVHVDATVDGSLAVLLEETRRGDVWVLETADRRRF